MNNAKNFLTENIPRFLIGGFVGFLIGSLFLRYYPLVYVVSISGLIVVISGIIIGSIRGRIQQGTSNNQNKYQGLFVNIGWKKNNLTRVMAVICLVGWTSGLLLLLLGGSSPEGDFFATIGAYFYFIFPASLVGSSQISISIRRWKELTTLDKVIFVIIAVGVFCSFVPFFNTRILSNF